MANSDPFAGLIAALTNTSGTKTKTKGNTSVTKTWTSAN